MAVTISGTSGINQDNIGTAPIKSFTSATQNCPTATSQAYTVTHTLGAVPRIVRLVAVCTVANNGWAVGDESEVMINGVDNGAYQQMPWCNSTQIGWSSGSQMVISNRTNWYNLGLISNTNFVLKVYAFA
jgi:hypothetical protein